MTLSAIFAKTTKTLKSNSPEILTALGVSGVITTAYLAAKASFRAADVIRESEAEYGYATDKKENFKIRTKLVWKYYVPAGISGALTIGCVVCASKANGKRTTAAVTAYSLTERAFTEYREKVVEQIGKGKEQGIRDEIAQDRVTRESSGSREVLVVGSGTVLCCDMHTMRYFRSDMESLKKAENAINSKILRDDYVAVNEFYELVGLPYTTSSGHIGWTSDKLMELRFSTVLADGGEPCLAFEYNYTKPIT